MPDEYLSTQEPEFSYLPFGKISSRTMEFYGALTKSVNDKPIEIGQPYEDNFKVRKLVGDGPKFVVKGDSFSEAGLYGQERYDPGSKPAVTIFEGESDTMAGYEMISRLSACVGLKNGASAARTTLSKQKVYEFVNSFDKIYICFDNDKAGRDAVASIQGMFDFKKVYVVKLTKRNDVREYLENDDVEEFRSVWENSRRHAPDNIISSFSDIEKALDESSEDLLAEYPFQELNGKLYGIHAGEVVVIKAPEGVGKTELFRAVEYHILKTTDHPIGIIHLEEDNATTIKAISGYELKVPATLPDCGLSKSDILDGYKRAVRDDEGRVHIHSSFDQEDEQAFYGTIRFLVSVLGCRIVCLDHISWMGTGLADDDERKKLDRISQNLKLLAKELRFAILEISHVNDDGKTRGSRNISKVANTVISISRDLLTGSNVMSFLVEKARLGGRTGPAGYAIFDGEKGILEAVNE